ELSILNFGSDEQKRRWLPGLCSGKQIAAIAIAEKQGASDAFDMLTVAEPAQNGYILNGEKCYITNVPFCDIILTFARVKDSHDILCLMVERNTAGIAVHEIEKLGMRTAPFGAIIFNNCFIPETNILGQKNSGKLIFMGAMEWERGCILAPEVGVMERRLRETIDYVKKREQNSLPLSQRQSVSHRIVDMKVRVELSRLLLYKFVWEKQTRKRANMYASMVKLYIAEAVLQNTLDAMQIYGAYGYTCAADVERELRDSLALRIASGTSDIQRNIIAKWLNL
ncbi:MAG TPA: acyl-CoA dehydrogenase, partial [Bacillota bacterium]|nr:acyl-CoA dehydrogenase [Bacillota bacterium]